jgi:hypothetical protein
MRRMSSRLWNIRWCMTIALVATVFPVATAQRVFAMDKAGFLNALGTLPRTVIDFDNISPDTDISGQQISGVQFVQVGAPLIVVNADDTYTPPDGWGGTARNPSQNKLIATTLKNVLSPGGRELVPGPDPNQEDSLILIFAQPIQAFGFDHISQSADGLSFTFVRVIGIDGLVLYSDRIPISNTGPADDALPAADFWGILFDSPLIARIEFIEADNNNTFPDCNIGYDTMIVVVPEPASCIALGAGLVGLMLRRRKVA